MDRLFLLLLLVVVIWGGNNATLRWLAQTTPVFSVICSRCFLASLPLLVWVWQTERSLAIPRADRSRFLLNGFLGLGTFLTLFTWSLRWTTAAHGALLLAAAPLITALWENLLHDKKVSPRFIIGALIAIIGVVLVVGLDALHYRNLMQLAGDGLALSSAAAWAYFAASQKPLLQHHSPVKINAIANVCTAVLTAPFALWECFHADWSRVGWGQAGGQLYSIVLATLFGATAWSYAIQREPASVVMLFQNLVPVTTALAAWLLLGEPVTWSLLWGGLLVFGGIAYSRRA